MLKPFVIGALPPLTATLPTAELHQDRGVVEQLGSGSLVDVGIELHRDLSVRVGDVDQHVPGPIGDRGLIDRIADAGSPTGQPS